MKFKIESILSKLVISTRSDESGLKIISTLPLQSIFVFSQCSLWSSPTFVDSSVTSLYSDGGLLTGLVTSLRLASTQKRVQICLELNSCMVSFGRIFFISTFYPQRGSISYFPKSGISTEPLGVVFLNMAISIATEARNSNLSWNIWVLLWEENKLYLFNLECYKAVSTVDSFFEILYTCLIVTLSSYTHVYRLNLFTL